MEALRPIDRDPAPSSLGWRVLAGLSVVVGVFSLRYALPRVPFAVPSLNFRAHHTALAVHAVSASLALLLGPWQFLPRWRRSRAHRYVGRAYVAVLLVAALAALWIAPSAAAGRVSSAGFGCLAIGWLITTSLGVVQIRRHDSAAHRRWMTRSFALTAAAITLRLYLALIPLLHWRFHIAYPIISWMCWVPNLLAAEVWLWWTAKRDLDQVVEG